jgi:hypothetical protein
MKNIIKLIIRFFKRLFGIKTEENKPSEPLSGDVMDSGSTEENNGSDEPQNTVSENTEEEDDCSKLIIMPSNEIGNGGEITFKTNL